MSKEAAVRAMREARYNERVAASSAAPKAPRQKEPTQKEHRQGVRPTVPAADQVAPAPATEGLCGHRSMNGRTCTREQGHAAKSHRYS